MSTYLADGANFTCTTCHMTDDHQISGSRYGHAGDDWQGCEDCHTTTPHKLDSLNSHSKVACQTCHIPEFARGGPPTKMTWDWSVAGQKDSNGKPLVTRDDAGEVIYDGKKGAFTFESFVVPYYVWYNGNVSYTMPGEEIDPTSMVAINDFLGDKDDPNAKIYPVKYFTAIQPYDSGNNILAIPHLFGKDEAAYWKSYDWNASIAAGMAAAGLPYSGNMISSVADVSGRSPTWWHLAVKLWAVTTATPQKKDGWTLPPWVMLKPMSPS